PKTSRQVTVSKAMSFILRHAAEKEGLAMDAQGYASVGDLLAWRKLKSLKVTFPEIVDAVASSDKKRFGLLYRPPSPSPSPSPTPTPATGELTAESTAAAANAGDPTNPKTADETEPATATALAAAAATDQDPTHYRIRATQGHSIKTVEAAGLLERLSLTTGADLPATVVHGTFHGAWPLILESGGLRCMGRNQVHFATGPAREEAEKDDGAVGGQGQVISGMRRDAQVLIYIDLVKALALGCPFWRSENGVILSEGIEGRVPLEVVEAVVERRLGTIWERGAVVQLWPAEWSRR
ncbi:phosphotransferase KptA/Tpt1, partial [Aspergillus indologenus CBS 114.80]